MGTGIEVNDKNAVKRYTLNFFMELVLRLWSRTGMRFPGNEVELIYPAPCCMHSEISCIIHTSGKYFLHSKPSGACCMGNRHLKCCFSLKLLKTEPVSKTGTNAQDVFQLNNFRFLFQILPFKGLAGICILFPETN